MKKIRIEIKDDLYKVITKKGKCVLVTKDEGEAKEFYKVLKNVENINLKNK